MIYNITQKRNHKYQTPWRSVVEVPTYLMNITIWVKYQTKKKVNLWNGGKEHLPLTDYRCSCFHSFLPLSSQCMDMYIYLGKLARNVLNLHNSKVIILCKNYYWILFKNLFYIFLDTTIRKNTSKTQGTWLRRTCYGFCTPNFVLS